MTEQTNPLLGKDGKEYPLTPKQEAFIRAYRNCGIASQAYQQVYGCKGWSREAINVAGSKSLAHPKIAAKLAELAQQSDAKVAITAEWLIDRLVKRADAADKANDRSAATQAEALAAKLAGLLVDKVDQTVRQAKPSDHRPDLQGIRARVKDSNAVPVDSDDATPHVVSSSTH